MTNNPKNTPNPTGYKKKYPPIELTHEPVWERQPGEPTTAYEAARLYFELGGERSLTKVAERLGSPYDTIKGRSARFRWAARAEAWDRHFWAITMGAREAVVVATAEAVAAQWGERYQRLREVEWERAQALVARADEILATPLEALRPTLGDAVRLLELASKLGRLATGAETERTAHAVVAAISSDEMARARADVEAWERERFGEGA